MAEKLERNQEIVAKYLTGDYSYHQLGQIYGISRERIKGIMQKYSEVKDRKEVIYKRRLEVWKNKKPKKKI